MSSMELFEVLARGDQSQQRHREGRKTAWALDGSSRYDPEKGL